MNKITFSISSPTNIIPELNLEKSRLTRSELSTLLQQVNSHQVEISQILAESIELAISKPLNKQLAIAKAFSDLGKQDRRDLREWLEDYDKPRSLSVSSFINGAASEEDVASRILAAFSSGKTSEVTSFEPNNDTGKKKSWFNRDKGWG